jgi:hypothetical protein
VSARCGAAAAAVARPYPQCVPDCVHTHRHKHRQTNTGMHTHTHTHTHTYTHTHTHTHSMRFYCFGRGLMDTCSSWTIRVMQTLSAERGKREEEGRASRKLRLVKLQYLQDPTIIHLLLRFRLMCTHSRLAPSSNTGTCLLLETWACFWVRARAYTMK